MKNAFAEHHPIVSFSYFFFVIAFSMTLLHPIFLAISVVVGIFYLLLIRGAKAWRLVFGFVLPIILLTTAINPLFNSRGATILGYLPNGNPLTLEAILFGLGTSLMLSAVIVWFACYGDIVTSDKFIYIFGKITPSLALVLSMIFRFVPRFKEQYRLVATARGGLEEGNLLKRAKRAALVLSIMVTWSLENSVDTADSMRARGYGLEGRTAFSIYNMQKRDIFALLAVLLSSAYLIAGLATKNLTFDYYPTMSGTSFSPYTASLFAVYIFLLTLPITIGILEEYKWKLYERKI